MDVGVDVGVRCRAWRKGKRLLEMKRVMEMATSSAEPTTK